MRDKHHISRWKHNFLIQGLKFCNVVCRVHYTVEGKENIPTEGQYLVVTNHLSRFDPMLAIILMKDFKLAFISKPENFKTPIAGIAIKWNHFIPIDRSNPKNGLVAIVQAVDMVKNGGFSIGVCPEGTRNATDEPMLPFHPGSFKIAMKTGIPVLLMAMVGTEKIGVNAPWKRTAVKVKVLGTLDPKDFKNTTDLSEAAHNQILSALERN